MQNDPFKKYVKHDCTCLHAATCLQTQTERERPKRTCTQAADRYLYLRVLFCQCTGITYNKVVSKCYTPNCRLCLTHVLFVMYMLGKDYHQNGVTNSRSTAANCQAPSCQKRRGVADILEASGTQGPRRASWEESVGLNS